MTWKFHNHTLPGNSTITHYRPTHAPWGRTHASIQGRESQVVIGFQRNTWTETPKEVIGPLESSCISRELCTFLCEVRWWVKKSDAPYPDRIFCICTCSRRTIKQHDIQNATNVKQVTLYPRVLIKTRIDTK